MCIGLERILLEPSRETIRRRELTSRSPSEQTKPGVQPIIWNGRIVHCCEYTLLVVSPKYAGCPKSHPSNIQVNLLFAVEFHGTLCMPRGSSSKRMAINLWEWRDNLVDVFEKKTRDRRGLCKFERVLCFWRLLWHCWLMKLGPSTDALLVLALKKRDFGNSLPQQSEP